MTQTFTIKIQANALDITAADVRSWIETGIADERNSLNGCSCYSDDVDEGEEAYKESWQLKQLKFTVKRNKEN